MTDGVVLEKFEVHDHAPSDQHPEDGQQLSLRKQIRFARFIDGVRYLGHAFVDRQRFRLQVLHDAEQCADGADDNAEHHERVPADAAQSVELHGAKVGNLDVCFAGARAKRQPDGV